MDIYDDDDILKILDIQAGMLKVSAEIYERVENLEAALERSDDVVTSHTERIDVLEDVPITAESDPVELTPLTEADLDAIHGPYEPVPDVHEEPVTAEEAALVRRLCEEDEPAEHVPFTPEELNCLTHSAREGLTGSADKVPEPDIPGIHPKVPESLFMPFIYVPGATEPLRIVKRLRRDKPNDDNWRLSIHDIERLVDLCTDILEREAKW